MPNLETFSLRRKKQSANATGRFVERVFVREKLNNPIG